MVALSGVLPGVWLMWKVAIEEGTELLCLLNGLLNASPKRRQWEGIETPCAGVYTRQPGL